MVKAIDKMHQNSVTFWQHLTVEELAAMQGVEPVFDPSTLLGGWPGELDDGFEQWIDEMRETEKDPSQEA